MSPCCIAAATLTAIITALTVVGLTGFVLVTDGFGLGLLVSTLLALSLQWGRLIGPCPRLLDGLSVLLAARAAWLLATSRRHLIVAIRRRVQPLAAKAHQRVRLLVRRRGVASGGPHAGHQAGPAAAHQGACRTQRCETR